MKMMLREDDIMALCPDLSNAGLTSLTVAPWAPYPGKSIMELGSALRNPATCSGMWLLRLPNMGIAVRTYVILPSFGLP